MKVYFKVGHFFVEDVWGDDKRCRFYGNFLYSVLEPNLQKIIYIKNIGKLKEFILSKPMSYSDVKKNVKKYNCMSLEVFFLVAYLLIFDSKKGEDFLGFSLEKFNTDYFFHVLIGKSLVSIEISWNDEWSFYARSSDWPGLSSNHRVNSRFLYLPNTALVK